MNNNKWAEFGIHSINHFAIDVPDLSVETDFLVNFGLRVTDKGEFLEVRAADSEHVWIRVGRGKQKKFTFLSVGCYQQDFEGLVKQILENGGKTAERPSLGIDDGFWFQDPHGRLLQLRVAPKMMPDSKALMPDMNVPAGVQGASNRSNARRVHPTRLAHMLLYTPSVPESLAFYEKGLGILTADRSGDGVAFTYARFGCDHHLIAFVTNNGIGIHHSSWDMPSIEDLGLGSEHMRCVGYDRQWGLGRHVLGSNYFNYVCDNYGKWWEYNCHIDYIPQGMTWDGGDHPAEDSFYLWGPEVPKGFAENNEA